MGKSWNHEKQAWVERKAWCPQCRSVHARLRLEWKQPKPICPVAEAWRKAHRDETIQDWRIDWAWEGAVRVLSRRDAAERRLNDPMHTVACPGCHVRYQSYERTGTQCATCSMEAE